MMFGIRNALFAAAALPLLVSSAASADSDSCREWQREHKQWMTQAVARYLRGAPQSELDAAVFEVLQREAYMTSCDVVVAKGRKELVGWRLVGRNPDEYGSAVLETVLACAGFDVGLSSLLDGNAIAAAAPPAPRPEPKSYRNRYKRGAR